MEESLWEMPGGNIGWIPEGRASSKGKKSPEAFLEEAGTVTWNMGEALEESQLDSRASSREKTIPGSFLWMGTAQGTTPASESPKQRLFLHV